MTNNHNYLLKPTHAQWQKLGWMLLSLVAALCLILALGAVYIFSPYFAPKFSGYLSDKSGHQITLGQDIDIKWSREPRFIFTKVHVGNAEWATDPALFEADRIEFSIRPFELLRGRLVIPELIAEKPVISLEKDADENANWKPAENPDALAVKAPAPEKRSEIPVISHLIITEGKLSYRDAKKKVNTVIDISTVQGESGKKSPIKLEGKGEYQGKPFKLDMSGASVLQLRESDEPYPFSLFVKIGATEARAEGTVQDPIKMEAFDIVLDLKGANAADLFPITGIALPPTPDYHVTGRLIRGESSWDFQDFKGKMGTSDLRGHVVWHSEQKPPYFEGEFISDNLDMKDLAGFVGADEKPADTDRVIPDKPIDISRLTAMNADITFKGTRVKSSDVLENVFLSGQLKDGTLHLNPLSFGIAKGKIDADVTIEGLKEPPKVTAKVNFKRLSLEKLFAPLAKKYGEENVSAGLFGGRADLIGYGKSLRTVLGTSDGSIGFGMEGGQLSKLLLDLAGLDIFKATGLILTGDKPAAMRCVVAQFGVQDGLMRTKEFLVDTDVNTIRTEGTLNLKDEKVDMRVTVYPKKASLLSANSPILLGGTLKNLRVGIDPIALAARGGVAAALSALLTPIGALIAFIDPGLGEDSNCSIYLRELDKKTGGAVPKN